MNKNYRVLIGTNVLGMSIVLLLSVVIYPLGFVVYASTAPSDDALTNNLNSNDTGSADPLSDAVLTFGDGTNVLNAESSSDSASNTASGGGADSGIDSTSSSSSDSSSVDDPSPDSLSRETGLDSSSLGPTGEVGSSTGEVGSSTGEVLPSDDAVGVEIIPSDGTPSGTEGGSESAVNVSTTDDETAPVGNNDAGASEEPVTAPLPSTQSDERGAEVGADLSSSSSSVDSNGNALTAESVTAASAENPNAVLQPISAGGDPQTVNFGDPSSNQESSATATLDRDNYSPGDTAILTITDPARNLDHDNANTVVVFVDGTPMIATENGPDSGVFTVSFVVTDSGNRLLYDASPPQARLDISGVSQPGSVEVREILVSEFQNTLGTGPPDEVIGNAIQVSFSDEVRLESNELCSALPVTGQCGGSTAVTISYANNAPDLNGQDPSTLKIWQYVPGVGWAELEEWTGVAPVIDLDARTVTAVTPFGEGTIILGFKTGGQGGGGGAIGLPGAGLVLDLVAPVTASEPPSSSDAPTSSSPESTTTSSPDTPILSVEDDADNSTSSISSLTQSSSPGIGISGESDIAKVSRNGNTTITVPGEGNVTLSFTNLISEGALTVSAAQDKDLAGYKVIKNAGGPAKVTSVDNTPYSLAGSVFVIGPTDTEFNGTITVSVPFKDALVPPGSEVKLLHYTGSGWEDVTTQGDPDTATGSLSSLGAVAPALKLQAINLVSAVK
jgi:hypothetical protein